MNKIIAFLLFFTFYISLPVYGQDLLKSKDLKAIVVDDLSDAQIEDIRSELSSKNMTIDQVESVALSKGMSASEFGKLRARLQKSNGQSYSSNSDVTVSESKDGPKQKTLTDSPKAVSKSNSLIFGSELFNNAALSFEPNLKLATPLNYVLGPDDELQISIYGVQEFNTALKVSSEGKISIPYVGQISVSGMTIEAATQKIKNAMAKVYSTVGSGQSKIAVNLSRIRTIRVTIIGSMQPGNYSVSSLATVYNALHLAGGPADNGSYRNIELIRNNKVFKSIDIYRFLINGDQSDDIGLKDNDVIRIPIYKNRVKLEGQVKRPGIFEVKGDETFSDLLEFASGFTDAAYTASINVTQKTDKEYKVKDILSSEFSTYKPLSGDVYKVSKILNRFQNRIVIEGAVFRPDFYSFNEGMKVSDLIAKAEGLREDAYTQRARIVRIKSDLTPEILNVDLEKALNGDVSANIDLKREDVVTVYSLLEFKESYTVIIDGEIKVPGTYAYVEGLTLNDLLIQAGGLNGAASKKVEIARMLKSEDVNKDGLKRVEVLNVEINAQNNEQLENVILFPFDVVNIRKLPVYEQPEMVTIKGEVNYPGKYVLANKEERIYDLITKAGGLTNQANINGVKIKRPIKADQIEDLDRIDLNLGKGDSIQKDLTDKVLKLKYATIPVDWKKIADSKNHYSNMMLLPGDEIEVMAFDEAVKISGNVLLTSEIPYRKGKGFNYYLDAVGGLDSKGWKKKSYIIYPNGKAATSSSFLFFRSYPDVEPGSQIVVPAKPESKKMSTAEVITIASVLTSLAGVIIAILR